MERLYTQRQLAFEPLEQRRMRAADANVWIGATADAYEGGQSGYVDVWRDETDEALDVQFQIDESANTATFYDDYWRLDATNDTVHFFDGQASARIDIWAGDDQLDELAETIVLNLTAHPDYNIASPSGATINVIDNDEPPPEIKMAVDDDGTGGCAELYDDMSSVDFGTTLVGTTETRTFTVENDAAAVADVTLHFDTMSLPTDFSFSGQSGDVSVVPGGSITFDVHLDASSAPRWGFDRRMVDYPRSAAGRRREQCVPTGDRRVRVKPTRGAVSFRHDQRLGRLAEADGTHACGSSFALLACAAPRSA